jgi:hypothetical protein
MTLISLNWTDFMCLPQVAVQSAHVLRINRNPAINTEQGLNQTNGKYSTAREGTSMRSKLPIKFIDWTSHSEHLKRQKSLIPKPLIP